jgi:hypothetical protein
VISRSAERTASLLRASASTAVPSIKLTRRSLLPSFSISNGLWVLWSKFLSPGLCVNVAPARSKYTPGPAGAVRPGILNRESRGESVRANKLTAASATITPDWRVHRSGVLVQIADKHFLVTAAHYLEATHNAGFDSFLARGKPGSHPLFIHTEKWYTTISEEADLAVCQLDEALVDYLGPTQKYLRISDFKPKQECQNG